MGCGASTKADSRISLLVERGVDESRPIRAESCSLSGVVSHLDETLKLAATLSVHRPSIEAETQTQMWSQRSGTGEERDAVARAEVVYGPLRVCQPPMQMLLVFAREDSQSDAFWWAAERGGYRCDIANDRLTAEDVYLERHHELVIIDLRSREALDGEEVCRCLRETRQSNYTIVMGIIGSNHEKVDINRLLSIGFDRLLTENVDINSCLAELDTIQRGEVRSQFKLLTSTAFIRAVESCNDSIEITTEEAVYQYVNPAFEKMTGFKREELIGQTPRQFKSSKTAQSIVEGMDASLRSGREWQGRLFGRRKSGEDFPEDVHVVPVFAPSGKVIHHVGIKRDISQQVEAYANLRQAAKSIAEVQEELHHSPLPNHKNGRRNRKLMTSPSLSANASRESVPSETPLAKVMSMLNKAQEQSGTANSVAQSLDRVIELLRSSELYSLWQADETIDDDPRTRDFVGGLMGPSRHILHSTSSADIQDGKKAKLAPCRGSVAPRKHHKQLPPLESASSDIRDILMKETSWNFDIINLERVTEKRPLYWLGLQIFRRLDLCNSLKISHCTLMEWLQQIEVNYHSANTYHNSTHAADVLHAAACFVERPKVKALLAWQDVVAILIAAIIHDVDHPGRTNSFLCATGHPLAILYNDTAVLESHHAAFAFKITAQSDYCNIFKGLPPEDYKEIRQSIIDMVLATDMKKHFECLKKFQTFLQLMTPDGAAELGTDFKVAMKQILIKTADIANPVRPWKLCQTWAHRISQEYFDQTDEEKRLGLPLHLPAFDQTTCNIPKSQTQFIEFFVLDLFSAWNQFAEIHDAMEHLKSNYEQWKKKAAAEQEKSQTPGSVVSSRTSESSFSLPVEEVS